MLTHLTLDVSKANDGWWRIEFWGGGKCWWTCVAGTEEEARAALRDKIAEFPEARERMRAFAREVLSMSDVES